MGGDLGTHLKVNLFGFGVLMLVCLGLLALRHRSLALWFFGAEIGWAVRGLAWAIVEYHAAKRAAGAPVTGDQR